MAAELNPNSTNTMAAEQIDISSKLRTFPMFQSMSDEDLKELAASMTEEVFPEGKIIIKEGDEGGDTMYLLLDGEAYIKKNTMYGDEYVTASVSSAYPCVFGEMALIDNAPRSASVVAKSVCRTLRMNRADFQSYCQRFPAVGCRLLMFIATNLVRNLRKENDNLQLVYQALIEEIEMS